MEVGGELLGQPGSRVGAKVFVCSTERTGSTLLCRAMTHRGIGVPVEYFNPHRISKIAHLRKIEALADGWALRSDSAARQAYMETLLEQDTANNIFASKIQWGQYATFLDNPEGDRFLSEGYFIHLYREDLLAQAISRHIAVETGRWGSDGRVTSKPASDPRYFDTDRIDGYLKVLAEAGTNWRSFFARNGIGPLTLTYEHLTSDLAGTVRTIVEKFGLDLPAPQSDYVAAGPEEARDSQVPPREEIRAHYLCAHRRIVPARLPARQPGAI